MEKPFRSKIALMGLGGRIERSETVCRPIDGDLRLPSPRVPICPEKPRPPIVPLRPSQVLVVDTAVRDTKISDSVVVSHPVDVVYLVGRPLTVEPKPRKSVKTVWLSVDVGAEVALAPFPADTIANVHPDRRLDLPCE